MSSKKAIYQHRKPAERDTRVITPENPAKTSRPCPYCGCKFSAAGSVTVTTTANFAHFTCHRCGRIFTIRSVR